MIAWFARHPTAANLFMAVFLIAGLVTVPGLQRETFPEVQNDEVQINVVYKGATTDEVEDAICRRLEDALDSLTDIDEIRCDAREGVAITTAVMREGADMARFLDDVKSAVDGIADLPSQTEKPVIEELGRTDAVVSVAITGPEDPVVLKAYAEDVRTRLRALDQVASVEIDGFAAHQIRVEIPAARLRQYGLSAADIAAAIQRQSLSSPAGRLEGENEDVLLRFDDQRQTVAEFADLAVISAAGGATIHLGEIATLTDRFELDEQKILFGGRRAAILHVAKTSAQDTLTVFGAVRDFVDAENARAPTGVRLELTQDRSSVVADRLRMLIGNGIQGLVLVFLVLWLFFSFRYSFWVTMGLPVSFLGALFLLPHLGITINMISMVGLLIGIGLLMDDAIVIAENIAARMAGGDAPMHAAVNGARQVLPGVLSSFATTVMVFGSLAFISGDIGQILRVIPIVLIVVLVVSLVEAFLILPSHLGHSLAHAHAAGPSRFRVAFDARFDAMRERVIGPWLDRAVEHRYLTVGLVVMLLLVAVAMPAGGKLKFVGFPTIDGDVVEARILLPQGTPLARTEAVVAQVVAALGRANEQFRPRQPRQQDLVRQVTVIYGENPDAYETGPHVARVVADLLATETRNARVSELRDAWRDAVGSLPDVIALKFTEGAVGPGGRAIDVRLLGTELTSLKQASADLRSWFQGFAGVIDLGDDLRPGKREYHLSLKPTAGVLGVSAAQVADQLRTAFQGLKVDEFPRGAETYEVDLRLSPDDRDGPADLDSLTVTGPDGAQIPLTQLVDVAERRGWARINRIDGQRAVTVQGDVQPDVANAQQLLVLAQKTVFPQLRERYPGLRIDVQGASKESATTGASIVRNVALGMIGVYMLLALQLRGYLAPVTVMIVIPTALIGVIFGHLLMGLDLTMPSMVGMASLFGVVVNDSILLVVFIRERCADGVAVAQAAKEAGRARFRPILLTSVTTIAGLLPMLLETSLQAQILIPLATSLAFGLTATTLIALFLVPAVYTILDDFGVAGEVEPHHG
ncbi:MAG: efflux RND transporter permease subunit [Chromatiaceae bacterium]|nr:efflux RND transporter permease subunit [Chromatiaceae bacterium]